MGIDLPSHVTEFIADLASLTSASVQVWLIGSRANGRARTDSDTDLLIFGPDGFIDKVRAKMQQPAETDCLIIYDGDNYRDPWQDKTGSLSQLGWKQVDHTTATYVATKWVSDAESSDELGADLGCVESHRERAWRVWPR